MSVPVDLMYAIHHSSVYLSVSIYLQNFLSSLLQHYLQQYKVYVFVCLNGYIKISVIRTEAMHFSEIIYYL